MPPGFRDESTAGLNQPDGAAETDPVGPPGQRPLLPTYEVAFSVSHLDNLLSFTEVLLSVSLDLQSHENLSHRPLPVRSEGSKFILATLTANIYFLY